MGMIELRTSERSLFHRCPQRWVWSVKEQLSPLRESTPLWFGTLIHIALAGWYRKGLERGPHPAETFLEHIKEERKVWTKSEDDELEFEDARELGEHMLVNYIHHYKRDEHQHWIATEKTGNVYLSDLRGRARQIKYHFTFDGVIRDLNDGFIKMVEHKSAGTISTTHLPLDQQGGSYWAVIIGKLKRAGLINDNDHVDAIEYNFLRKAKKDTRPVNALGQHTNQPLKDHFHQTFLKVGLPEELWRPLKMDALAKLAYHEGIKVLGEVSKSQPLPLFHRESVFRTPEERLSQLKLIRKDAWHIEQARNNPNYPIVKNVMTTGPLACQGCPFFRMCQLDEQGDQESVEEYKAAMYTKRDPYAAYRKNA